MLAKLISLISTDVQLDLTAVKLEYKNLTSQKFHPFFCSLSHSARSCTIATIFKYNNFQLLVIVWTQHIRTERKFSILFFAFYNSKKTAKCLKVNIQNRDRKIIVKCLRVNCCVVLWM